ncbi:MAG TPA: transglutaminaseTgpA domain-containing protein, partial [Anaerolineae bacterium]
PLSESEATVMWVQVSDPPPTLNEQGLTVAPARTHYWRSAVFSEYDGTGWKLAVAGENEFTFEPPATAPPGRYTLRQEYEIVAQHADDLFAVNTPVTATEGAAVRWLAPNGDAVLRGTPSTYAVTSWATNVAASQLISDSTDYPAEIRNTYLQLPDTLPARVRDLADRVTSGAGTPYDKAIRLQDYLRLAYPYRLDVPPPPPGVDAVDYFLFDAPGGFCTYYASAMVVMLRMEGVPARVAAGFAMGEYDSSRQAYRVPASSMHAWVEVYFPDYGWIEFEPTAAQAVFDYRAADTSVVAPPPAPPSATSSVPTALSLVFLAAALIGVYVLARVAIGYVPLFSLGRHDHGKQSHTLYWQVRKDLSRIGFGARANVTPGEFLSASAGRLAERKRLRDALQAITALYIKATFTSNPPTKADVQTSRTMWRQAWRDRLGLRLRMMSARALKR